MPIPTTTATGTCIDSHGDPMSGVILTIKLSSTPDGSEGMIVDISPFTITSNEDGAVTTTLIRGATYDIKSGDGEYIRFKTDSDDESTTLPNMFGGTDLDDEEE